MREVLSSGVLALALAGCDVPTAPTVPNEVPASVALSLESSLKANTDGGSWALDYLVIDSIGPSVTFRTDDGIYTFLRTPAYDSFGRRREASYRMSSLDVSAEAAAADIRGALGREQEARKAYREHR